MKKHLLLIIFLALAALANAQEGALKNLKIGAVTSSGQFTCDTCKLSLYNFTSRVMDPSWKLTTANQVKMRISTPDSNGEIKVWIDPKYIRFTSDTTFTITKNPKK